MIPENVTLYATLAIAMANVILIAFYYLQLRESKKAIIVTKFMGAEKDNGSKEEILEQLPQYLYVENISNNAIRNLTISGVLNFGKGKVTIKRKLSYLNPHERAKILIRLGDIIDKYPKLFEEHEEKRQGTKVFLKIPKETLNIKFSILFKWNILNKQKDDYFIEWLSKKNCPDLKYHPRINSWNRRNDIYVEKIK